MKIEMAIQILDRSISEGGTNEEIKLKQSLSNVLHELRSKNFNEAQLAILEREIDRVLLDSGKDGKHLKKSYKVFIKTLHNDFSLLPEGHCAGNGLIYGLMAGTLFLAISIVYTESSLKYYLPLGGMLLGMLIGSYCDHLVKKKGRALLTKMY